MVHEFQQSGCLCAALFWAVTQRVVVIPYRRFVQTFALIFKGEESLREWIVNKRTVKEWIGLDWFGLKWFRMSVTGWLL